MGILRYEKLTQTVLKRTLNCNDVLRKSALFYGGATGESRNFCHAFKDLIVKTAEHAFGAFS
jgi:hypothetical protein